MLMRCAAVANPRFTLGADGQTVSAIDLIANPPRPVEPFACMGFKVGGLLVSCT
ncbi:MAG: hypothetical protein WCB11_24845 [Terriglobales bacterium]